MTRMIELKGTRGTRTFIRPESVDAINIQNDGHAYVYVRGDAFSIMPEDAERLVDEINGAAAPAPVRPDALPLLVPAELVAMTRDQTKNSGSPMWRCATETGVMVYVFEHSDPLRDTFHLFEDAGFGGYMRQMNLGDTITWTREPVSVQLVKNGDFWKVVSVVEQADGQLPDEPEPDDESDSDE